jgi:hypothetical protein
MAALQLPDIPASGFQPTLSGYVRGKLPKGEVSTFTDCARVLCESLATRACDQGAVGGGTGLPAAGPRSVAAHPAARPSPDRGDARRHPRGCSRCPALLRLHQCAASLRPALQPPPPPGAAPCTPHPPTPSPTQLAPAHSPSTVLIPTHLPNGPAARPAASAKFGSPESIKEVAAKVLPRIAQFGNVPPAILPVLVALKKLPEDKKTERKLLRLVNYFVQLLAGEGTAGSVVPFHASQHGQLVEPAVGQFGPDQLEQAWADATVDFMPHYKRTAALRALAALARSAFVVQPDDTTYMGGLFQIVSATCRALLASAPCWDRGAASAGATARLRQWQQPG